MAAKPPALDKQVQVQIDRIIDEDDRGHSPEEIERLAREAAERYEGAPVQQYIPNLVYNEVKSKLIAG
jgi:hypothetical protein